jgi:subtilase family serine protease
MFGTVPRQPGPLSMTVTADPLGVIPEGDETDNSATDTITVQPPDLTATVTGSSALAPGESGSWTVRLGNSGPAVARLTSSLNSILTISLPGLSDVAVTPPAGFSCVATPFYPEIWECEPTSTQTIAVGGAVAFTVTGTAPTSGEALVAAVADSYEVIPEADEMNNQGSLDVVVG